MIIDALKYKIWADERTLRAIKRIDKHVFSKQYRFVLQQLNHMVIVEDLFKSRLEAKPAPHKATNTDIVPEFDELKGRLLESGKWYSDYSSNLNIEKNQSTISFRFAEKGYSMSVSEMLFHVVNHGSYHRGSIASALDLATVAHPIDGFCAYIHEAEPNRRY